jgi:arsenic resistance protein ArsH
MSCITIPNQSSVPKAFQQFDDNDRMLASPFYDRMITKASKSVELSTLAGHKLRY